MKNKLTEIIREVSISKKVYGQYVEDVADKLIAEGILLLPCKVGDMVYMPWCWNEQKGIACLKVTVLKNILGFEWTYGTDFNSDDEEYSEKYNYGHFCFADIGKTIFLTFEEAEKALTEIGDG